MHLEQTVTQGHSSGAPQGLETAHRVLAHVLPSFSRSSRDAQGLFHPNLLICLQRLQPKSSDSLSTSFHPPLQELVKRQWRIAGGRKRVQERKKKGKELETWALWPEVGANDPSPLPLPPSSPLGQLSTVTLQWALTVFMPTMDFSTLVTYMQ